ncbi:hypothetical protein KTR10_02530 [Candidatus Kaiserbacteria bacterium]|nr:hypothetical protein [Candidatus Kaiserbacteria bacterium]
MQIFIDLDNTLFDTVQLGLDTASLLQKTYDIPPEIYEQARQEMFADNNKIYSAKLHAEYIGQKTEVPNNFVDIFLDLFRNEDSEKYVFDGVFDFIAECSKLGTVRILTYGEEFVQRPRSLKSGIAKVVSDVIVTQDNKADTIKEYFGNDVPKETIVLIDDSVEHLDDIQHAFPDSLTIHIDHGGSHNRENGSHTYAQSFDEIEALLLEKST